MAAFDAENGVRLTLSFRRGPDRYDCVTSWARNGALNWAETCRDFIQWFGAVPQAGKWQDAFGTDCFFIGIGVGPMVHGRIQPERELFNGGGYQGTIASESCPINSSVVLARYSIEQIQQPAGRTKVSKVFAGPAPENSQAGGYLDEAYRAGVLSQWMSVLSAPFLGAVTGHTYHPMVNIVRSAGGSLWLVDSAFARPTTFTQRRRMRPLL